MLVNSTFGHIRGFFSAILKLAKLPTAIHLPAPFYAQLEPAETHQLTSASSFYTCC